MRTLYYINGKRVDIRTYFDTIRADKERKYLWKRCVKYYVDHPLEFQLNSCFYGGTDPICMMMRWERTSDYIEAMKEVNKMRKKDRRWMLCVLIIAFICCFILPFVIIAMQD